MNQALVALIIAALLLVIIFVIKDGGPTDGST